MSNLWIIKDADGNITNPCIRGEESWEKAREILKTGELGEEHASYLAEKKEPLVEPAQERVVKKIFKVQEDS